MASAIYIAEQISAVETWYRSKYAKEKLGSYPE